MNVKLRCLLWAIALSAVAASSPLRPVLAQAPPPDPQEDEAAEKTLREQNIYIPYEKLREVFEKHGRGVFLPYEKFQELWRAAREKIPTPAEQKPPVGALITEIRSEATVEKDVVKVKAVLKIEVFKEGWNEVSLGLADAAITSATLGAEPARIIGDAGRNYRLLVEKEGKPPEQFELELEYAKAITRVPGLNSVSFQAPRAPVSRWQVRIPESDVKVNIHPIIAATEVPAGAPADPAAPAPGETVLLAFVGAAPTVRIDWTPKAEGATGLEALASVQAQQQVWINEGVTRTRTRLAYTISRAELDQLVIEVPADHKVVNVFDANVRKWSVEKAGPDAPVQKITAELYEPAKGSQQVAVELEKFAAGGPQDTVKVPVVKAVLDGGRQQGVVVVQVAGGLRAEATRTGGLLQVDATELPSPSVGQGTRPTDGRLGQGKWDFSYRYSTVPFDLELSIEKVQPRILVESLVEAYLKPEKLSVDMTSVYTVQRAGVFRLELVVPAGYEVRHVRGRAVAGAQAAVVDSHHLEGENNTRLVVNLARKAKPDQRVGLVVQLEKDLAEPDLLAPTGKAAGIPLPIPRVALDTVERAAGRLVVYAPESLRVNPAKDEGLRSVSFAEALEGMQSTGRQKSLGLRPVLAFAYTEGPIVLELAVERRKPQVTIEQLLVARIENGVVKYRATLFYEILYSGVKSLRIDVPSDVSDELRNVTPWVQEKRIDPPPGDLAKGDVAWSLAAKGESELLGKGKIELVWEKKIEKLDVGKSVQLVIPRIKPREVNRAWGQIVLAKAETLDVQKEKMSESLLPIDPRRDLIAKVDGAARAFEFHDDWTLSITATRYRLEEVKRTSIERAVVRMVVTRAKVLRVQALYRMRSARQQLRLQLPDGVQLDTEPLIDGRRVPLQTEGGNYYVPLVDSNEDEQFLLELRYTVPGNGSRLDLPAFPDQPAVQKLYLCAYLPEEWALLGTSGPWTEEFRWALPPQFRWWRPLTWKWVPTPRPIDQSQRWSAQLLHDKYLVAWVRGRGQVSGGPAHPFQTDGQLYVFSTLQPSHRWDVENAPPNGRPPGGSLYVKTTSERLLHAIVFGLVLLAGLLLLPARTSQRVLAVGVLITLLVLCGVFCPTFSMHVLDGVLALAILIVLVVWVVWCFTWTLPHCARRRRAAAAAVPPLPDKVADSAAEPRESPEPAEEPPSPPEDKPETDQGADSDSDEGGKTDA